MSKAKEDKNLLEAQEIKALITICMEYQTDVKTAAAVLRITNKLQNQLNELEQS